MSKKHLDTKVLSSQLRFKSLARSLHARILAPQPGKVFLLRGQPDSEKLFRFLLQPSFLPRTIDDLRQSRFPIRIDGEISKCSMNVFSCALTRWSRCFDGSQLSSRRRDRQTAEKISTEKSEIDRLRMRLTACFRSMRGVTDAGFPYILCQEEIGEFERSVECSSAKTAFGFPARVKWVARFVYWIAGSAACQRFLRLFEEVDVFVWRPAAIDELIAFRDKTQTWKRRLTKKTKNLIRNEIRNEIKELDDELVQAGNLQIGKGAANLDEHCDRLIANCERLILRQTAIVHHLLPAAVATLAICDESSSPLPQCFVRMVLCAPSIRDVEKVILRFLVQAPQAGYDRLLRNIDTFSIDDAGRTIAVIRKRLAAAESPEDVAWATDNLPIRAIPFEAKLRWLREIASLFETRKVPLGKSGLLAIASRLNERPDVVKFCRIQKWLDNIAADRWPLTAAAQARITSAIVELILPALLGLKDSLKVRHWIAVCGFDSRPNVSGEMDQTNWQRRISNFQAMAHRPQRIPKSIKRLTDESDRISREIAYIQSKCELGIATQRQMDRLSSLRKKIEEDRSRKESKIAKAWRDSFIEFSLAALTHLIREQLSKRWCDLTGEPAENISIPQLIASSRWLDEMSFDQLRAVMELTSKWKRYGEIYKSKLSENQDWIKRARENNVDMSVWLGGIGSKMRHVEDRQVTINITSDPVEIFKMGRLFNTCLAFGGCNQMALIANAYDANKQVVYMRDLQGNIICRQLIALTREFKLVGFCCYVSTGKHRDQENRSAFISAMARYCGELARQSGVSLASDGEVEAIGDHFWFDDGSFQWHFAAHEPFRNPEVVRNTLQWQQLEFVHPPAHDLYSVAYASPRQ